MTLSLILYCIVSALLLLLEIGYFRMADRFNIIDKPNERSSHSSIVLRGGGVIFTINIVVWLLFQMVMTNDYLVTAHLPFILGLMMVAVVSFIDDIHSLPNKFRLITQFSGVALMLFNVMRKTELAAEMPWWVMIPVVIVALIVCVGALNIINFMDGINGITAGYSLSVLIPILAIDLFVMPDTICRSMLGMVIMSVLVFSWFNFRPRGKAKCFAGDVGSIGIGFIMLFFISNLIVHTKDITWLVMLVVYGVDGVMTILHRLMLHENLGKAHRKHAYQIMANELKMNHVTVSCIYMLLQLTISFGFIYLCPDNIACHWMYLGGVVVVLAMVYILFMKKFYYLHEEYLASLEMKEV